MSDEEIIVRFESGGVPATAFHHEDHVRLAFSYLRTCPVLEGLQRFSCALKQFAASHGKADRYHETITFAYFFLIHERMANSAASDWQQFLNCNLDLIEGNNRILKRYYDESTLKSDLARRVFVFPDCYLPQ